MKDRLILACVEPARVLDPGAWSDPDIESVTAMGPGSWEVAHVWRLARLLRFTLRYSREGEGLRWSLVQGPFLVHEGAFRPVAGGLEVEWEVLPGASIPAAVLRGLVEEALQRRAVDPGPPQPKSPS